jgi:hypothetical protein
MRLLLVSILSLLSIAVSAQCKTYKLSPRKDTLNCTDIKGLKQGKWVVRMEEVRGEPGYEEEGIFKNNKKEGPWRMYNLMGDFIALENYKWGNKDGICKYYTLAGLEHEESWHAVNPANPYDTIDVPDVYNPDKVERKVIKLDGSSVKNGVWTYYDPGFGTILKQETYVLDKLQTAGGAANHVVAANTSDSTQTKIAPPKTAKPQQVLQYEKKNSGKKPSKLRDGSTGG